MTNFHSENIFSRFFDNKYKFLTVQIKVQVLNVNYQVSTVKVFNFLWAARSQLSDLSASRKLSSLICQNSKFYASNQVSTVRFSISCQLSSLNCQIFPFLVSCQVSNVNIFNFLLTVKPQLTDFLPGFKPQLSDFKFLVSYQVSTQLWDLTNSC